MPIKKQRDEKTGAISPTLQPIPQELVDLSEVPSRVPAPNQEYQTIFGADSPKAFLDTSSNIFEALQAAAVGTTQIAVAGGETLDADLKYRQTQDVLRNQDLNAEIIKIDTDTSKTPFEKALIKSELYGAAQSEAATKAAELTWGSDQAIALGQGSSIEQTEQIFDAIINGQAYALNMDTDNKVRFWNILNQRLQKQYPGFRDAIDNKIQEEVLKVFTQVVTDETESTLIAGETAYINLQTSSSIGVNTDVYESPDALFGMILSKMGENGASVPKRGTPSYEALLLFSTKRAHENSARRMIAEEEEKTRNQTTFLRDESNDPASQMGVWENLFFRRGFEKGILEFIATSIAPVNQGGEHKAYAAGRSISRLRATIESSHNYPRLATIIRGINTRHNNYEFSDDEVSLIQSIQNGDPENDINLFQVDNEDTAVARLMIKEILKKAIDYKALSNVNHLMEDPALQSAFSQGFVQSKIETIDEIYKQERRVDEERAKQNNGGVFTDQSLSAAGKTEAKAAIESDWSPQAGTNRTYGPTPQQTQELIRWQAGKDKSEGTGREILEYTGYISPELLLQAKTNSNIPATREQEADAQKVTNPGLIQRLLTGNRADQSAIYNWLNKTFMWHIDRLSAAIDVGGGVDIGAVDAHMYKSYVDTIYDSESSIKEKEEAAINIEKQLERYGIELPLPRDIEVAARQRDIRAARALEGYNAESTDSLSNVSYVHSQVETLGDDRTIGNIHRLAQDVYNNISSRGFVTEEYPWPTKLDGEAIPTLGYFLYLNEVEEITSGMYKKPIADIPPEVIMEVEAIKAELDIFKGTLISQYGQAKYKDTGRNLFVNVDGTTRLDIANPDVFKDMLTLSILGGPENSPKVNEFLMAHLKTIANNLRDVMGSNPDEGIKVWNDPDNASTRDQDKILDHIAIAMSNPDTRINLPNDMRSYMRTNILPHFLRNYDNMNHVLSQINRGGTPGDKSYQRNIELSLHHFLDEDAGRRGAAESALYQAFVTSPYMDYEANSIERRFGSKQGPDQHTSYTENAPAMVAAFLGYGGGTSGLGGEPAIGNIGMLDSVTKEIYEWAQNSEIPLSPAVQGICTLLGSPLRDSSEHPAPGDVGTISEAILVALIDKLTEDPLIRARLNSAESVEDICRQTLGAIGRESQNAPVQHIMGILNDSSFGRDQVHISFQQSANPNNASTLRLEDGMFYTASGEEEDPTRLEDAELWRSMAKELRAGNWEIHVSYLSPNGFPTNDNQTITPDVRLSTATGNTDRARAEALFAPALQVKNLPYSNAELSQVTADRTHGIPYMARSKMAGEAVGMFIDLLREIGISGNVDLSFLADACNVQYGPNMQRIYSSDTTLTGDKDIWGQVGTHFTQNPAAYSSEEIQTAEREPGDVRTEIGSDLFSLKTQLATIVAMYIEVAALKDPDYRFPAWHEKHPNKSFSDLSHDEKKEHVALVIKELRDGFFDDVTDEGYAPTIWSDIPTAESRVAAYIDTQGNLHYTTRRVVGREKNWNPIEGGDLTQGQETLRSNPSRTTITEATFGQNDSGAIPPLSAMVERLYTAAYANQTRYNAPVNFTEANNTFWMATARGPESWMGTAQGADPIVYRGGLGNVAGWFDSALQSRTSVLQEEGFTTWHGGQLGGSSAGANQITGKITGGYYGYINNDWLSGGYLKNMSIDTYGMEIPSLYGSDNPRIIQRPSLPPPPFSVPHIPILSNP